jgi:hypothetical protein
MRIKEETEVPGGQGRRRRNIVVTIVIVVVVDVQPIIFEVERTATSPHHLLLKPFLVQTPLGVGPTTQSPPIDPVHRSHGCILFGGVVSDAIFTAR